MLAQELISNDIVPLKLADTGMLALSLMEEYKTTHLPVVSDGHLFGLLSEADVYSHNQFEEPIEDHLISLGSVSANPSQHIFEVLELIHNHKLSLLPVIDDNNRYLGSILLNELIVNLTKITGITNPGGVIILEMNVHDYSLSEIARIAESNNIKIINSFVNSFDDSTKIEVTIKLNSVDIDAVLQTFVRYGYQIKASFTETDLNDNMNDRYDSLMNYLNI